MLIDVKVTDVTLNAGDASLTVHVDGFDYQVFPNGRIVRRINNGTEKFPHMQELLPGEQAFSPVGADLITWWWDKGQKAPAFPFEAYQDILNVLPEPWKLPMHEHKERLPVATFTRFVYDAKSRLLRREQIAAQHAFTSEAMLGVIVNWRGPLLSEHMRNTYFKKGYIPSFLAMDWYPVTLPYKQEVLIGDFSRLTRPFKGERLLIEGALD